MNDSFGFIINNFNLGISIYFFFWICFIWISTEIPKVSFICLCRFYILWYLFIYCVYMVSLGISVIINVNVSVGMYSVSSRARTPLTSYLT